MSIQHKFYQTNFGQLDNNWLANNGVNTNNF